MEKSEEQLSLNLENKNELTVFDQVKHELDIQRDPMEFKVPLSDIFGKTSLAPKSSFGQVTFGRFIISRKELIECIHNSSRCFS